jgi:hypothetical protein
VTSVLPPTDTTPSFIIGASQKTYKHQYSNIYFLRLRMLKDLVIKSAQKKWQRLAGEHDGPCVPVDNRQQLQTSPPSYLEC